MDRLLYRHEISGIHRICHNPQSRDGNVPCFNCPSRAKCNAAIFDKLARYEETGYTPEEIAFILETYVPEYERRRKIKENELIARVYGKVDNMTEDQMLDLVFDTYDDYCKICKIRSSGCGGTSYGPSGPIFPGCADGFGDKLLDRAALYDEVVEILMDQEDDT